MIRATTLAFVAATMLAGTGASAQVIDLGRGGPSVDLRSDRQRDRDYQREQGGRDSYRSERRSDRDNFSTGSVGNCRMVTTTERDDYGRSVTRQSRECR